MLPNVTQRNDPRGTMKYREETSLCQFSFDTKQWKTLGYLRFWALACPVALTAARWSHTHPKVYTNVLKIKALFEITRLKRRILVPWRGVLIFVFFHAEIPVRP
jgi:hypothetical protein